MSEPRIAPAASNSALRRPVMASRPDRALSVHNERLPRARKSGAATQNATPVTDSVVADGVAATRARLRGPASATPQLATPGAGGVATRSSGNTLSTRAALTSAPAGVSPATAASATTRVSPVPPGYTVPADLAPSEPVSLGSRILNGIGVALFAPIYLIFAIIALIPSLIGGAVEAPKQDQSDGSGTFMAGFANVYRAMMGWLSRPLYKMIWGAASPARKFYVDRTTDPNNVIITVRVRLTGDPTYVAQVKALEEEIERNMAIPGYMVNVEFVDQDGPAVTTIPIDPNTWSNNTAWNPLTGDNRIDANDAHMIAHELFHTPLGLPDEYNLQEHFVNPNMGFWQRLGTFFARLVQPELPADAANGIMQNDYRKPLPRHYEEVLRNA